MYSLGLLIACIQGEVIVENDCALINVNAFGHDIGGDEDIFLTNGRNENF